MRYTPTVVLYSHYVCTVIISSLQYHHQDFINLWITNRDSGLQHEGWRGFDSVEETHQIWSLLLGISIRKEKTRWIPFISLNTCKPRMSWVLTHLRDESRCRSLNSCCFLRSISIPIFKSPSYLWLRSW